MPSRTSEWIRSPLTPELSLLPTTLSSDDASSSLILLFLSLSCSCCSRLSVLVRLISLSTIATGLQSFVADCFCVGFSDGTSDFSVSMLFCIYSREFGRSICSVELSFSTGGSSCYGRQYSSWGSSTFGSMTFSDDSSVPSSGMQNFYFAIISLTQASPSDFSSGGMLGLAGSSSSPVMLRQLFLFKGTSAPKFSFSCSAICCLAVSGVVTSGYYGFVSPSYELW